MALVPDTESPWKSELGKDCTNQKRNVVTSNIYPVLGNNNSQGQPQLRVLPSSTQEWCLQWQSTRERIEIRC